MPDEPTNTAGLEWMADAAPFEAWATGAPEPFDDVPEFGAGDSEVDVIAHLPGDRAYINRPKRRLFVDYRPNPDAFLHLEKLPAKGESLHGVICGKYALWDLVPALIGRTKLGIRELHIATLSYGKSNAAELLDLIDEGRIGKVSLLVSYFFKAQNRALYDTLVPPLLDRGHRVLAMRTHCKIILAKMTRGDCYVVEASANLRSCKNVEQFVLTRDAKLYNFHRSWLEGELLRPRTQEEAAE